ncbi:PEP/pyruvate-binding domain-containing protein [Galactobacter valiniphilus]|uniref:PEP/pyruvate-binding domain-containing protein n=1 Tax=Galactobacter valiniphilus TaxID=2676122 RepID=UPI0037352908
MGRFVQHFDEGIEPTIENLGGKGASLVTMTAAGMPVPPGFVVTTATFDEFMHGTGLTERIGALLQDLDPENVAQVDEVSARIREAIMQQHVPASLDTTHEDSYRVFAARFGGADVPVAVRSSATAEDLPDASFAGQQDTYLWVTGLEAIREHIHRCWASLYTSRAITYRLKNNIPDEGLSMAVVVQKMVNSRVSGVAMTLDPATGDRSKITVDASWGVGEMVVSGTVTPDNIQLDKITLHPVRETIGEKHAELVPEGNALVEREVSPERRAQRCLSDAELHAVAALAKAAEKHYKTPQDIEWALDADLPAGEDLLLLQARPETVHSSKAPAPATKPATSGGWASSLGIKTTPSS